jgi:hypothetical protein
MNAAMTSLPRARVAVAALILLRPLAGTAWSDHGGALRSPPMSPVLAGLIAAALALVAGIAVVAVVILLSRRTPRE